MLARLEPALLDRLSFPLGRADQGRGARAGPGRRPARGGPAARARTSASRPALGSRGFLRRHAPGGLRQPGRIVDRAGRQLGRHDGQHEFTVGQRRGIGVAAPEPLYVLEKDAATATVVVGPREALAVTRVTLEAASAPP